MRPFGRTFTSCCAFLHLIAAIVCLFGLVVATLPVHPVPVLAAEDPPTYLFGWGSAGTGEGEFSQPHDVAADGEGNVYVADTGNNRVQKFDAAGNYVDEWGTGGSADGAFNFPCGIAVDADGNVYVTDTYNYRVQKFDDEGALLDKWGSCGDGDLQFRLPVGIDVDESGDVYVTDFSGNCVKKYNGDGEFITRWGGLGSDDGQFDGPTAVSVDSASHVHVADCNNRRVQVFAWNAGSSAYQFSRKYGTSGTGEGEFGTIWGLDVDSEDNCYPVDTGNDRVQKFDDSGAFLTMWGAYVDAPMGIDIDESGAIYVADSGNNCIRVFGEASSAAIELSTGWNMVSAPVEAADMSVDAVFPDAEAVYWWDPSTKSYTVPTTIEPEKSYWVAVTQNDTVTIIGTPVTTWTDALATGWNMVGSVYGDPVGVDDLVDAASGSIQTSAIYHWNPVTKSYGVADQIEQGLSYWAATTETCDLTVAPSA